MLHLMIKKIIFHLKHGKKDMHHVVIIGMIIGGLVSLFLVHHGGLSVNKTALDSSSMIEELEFPTKPYQNNTFIYWKQTCVLNCHWNRIKTFADFESAKQYHEKEGSKK